MEEKLATKHSRMVPGIIRCRCLHPRRAERKGDIGEICFSAFRGVIKNINRLI